MASGFETFVFTDGTVQNNDGSPLVDDLFYYSRYHDVWNAHADADAHYNAFGWHENRDPNAFFSTGFYLALNPDVQAAGTNPLAHFDASGWQQGRVARSSSIPPPYLAANPDVAAAQVDPLAHFLGFGAQEGRVPFAWRELFAANGFDYVYYLQHNPVQHIPETSMEWAFLGCSPARTTGWDYTGTTRQNLRAVSRERTRGRPQKGRAASRPLPCPRRSVRQRSATTSERRDPAMKRTRLARQLCAHACCRNLIGGSLKLLGICPDPSGLHSAGKVFCRLPDAIDRSNKIQEALWQRVKALSVDDRNMVPTGLFILALNDVIDSQGKRLAALRNYIPHVVWLSLFGMTAVACGFAGYASGLDPLRTRCRSSLRFF